MASERNSTAKIEETQLRLQTALITRIRSLQEDIPDRKKDLHEYVDFRAQGTLVEIRRGL
jgi:hypothetical protein